MQEDYKIEKNTRDGDRQREKYGRRPTGTERLYKTDEKNTRDGDRERSRTGEGRRENSEGEKENEKNMQAIDDHQGGKRGEMEREREIETDQTEVKI